MKNFLPLFLSGLWNIGAACRNGPARPILLIALFAALSGCVAREIDDRPQGPIDVQIPLMTKGAPEGEGSYVMQTVRVNSVENMQFFIGPAARFYYAPGSVEGKVVGVQPIVKLGRDANGVYFPLDVLSMQIVSIYYHLEKLRELDIALNQESLSSWPRAVAVEARIQNTERDRRHNNAFYSPSLKAMIFVPYSLSDLPIQVNGGVIAHEHFHALFDQIVERPLRTKGFIPENVELQSGDCTDSCLRALSRATLLRALNEGLADIWAWNYQGDAVFVSRSLKGNRRRLREARREHQRLADVRAVDVPAEEKPNRNFCGPETDIPDSRDLNAPVRSTLESANYIKDCASRLSSGARDFRRAQERAVSISYRLGARMARVMKQFVSGGEGKIQPNNFSDQKRIAEAIVAGLRRVETRLSSMSETDDIEPSELVAEIIDELAALNETNCSLAREKLGKAVKGRCAGVGEPSRSARVSAARGPSSQVIQRSLPSSASPLRLAILLNSDHRYELDETQNLQQKQVLGIGVGLRKGRWMGLLEGSRARADSQLGNIAIGTVKEQVSLSGVLFARLPSVDPYLSAGLAFFRNTADYSVDSSSAQSRGVWEPTNTFAAGIRFFPQEKVWLSTEGRVHVGGRIHTDPTFGFVLRLGVDLTL